MTKSSGSHKNYNLVSVSVNFVTMMMKPPLLNKAVILTLTITFP